jgi:outer membrane protein W
MRKVLIAAGVVSMVSLSMAQHLEVGVDGGYGLGVGTALAGKSYTIEQNGTNYNYAKYEVIYASGGEGLKMTGQITYFFNDNIGVMVASGYSMLGGYSTEKIEPLDTNYSTITSRYLPINIGVKFKTKMGIIEPYIYLAPGVYFPQKTSDSTAIHVLPFGGGITRDTINTTVYYALGWGVSAGIGAVLRVSEKVGITLEITPTYAFAKQTKYEQKGGGSPGTYVYKDNEASSYGDAPVDSYSSVAVKAGLCFKIF